MPVTDTPSWYKGPHGGTHSAQDNMLELLLGLNKLTDAPKPPPDLLTHMQMDPHYPSVGQVKNFGDIYKPPVTDPQSRYTVNGGNLYKYDPLDEMVRALKAPETVY